MKDKYGHLVFDLRSLTLRDRSIFPHGDRARQLEVVQEEGEVIFVPSRWHHQVFNLVSFFFVVSLLVAYLAVYRKHYNKFWKVSLKVDNGGNTER